MYWLKGSKYSIAFITNSKLLKTENWRLVKFKAFHNTQM